MSVDTAEAEATAPMWMLFCTYYSNDNDMFLIAEINDEISAVRAFNRHVQTFGQTHVPYIAMHPIGHVEETGRVEGNGHQYRLKEGCEDSHNLFREPVAIVGAAA